MENKEQERKGFSNPEIQKIEADRMEPAKWNVIHLLRDGNYWHANEWSAWLMSVIIHNEMKSRYPDEERIPITPVKKFAKNINGEYVFVGCQEKSFDKYLPKEMQLNWIPVDNLRIDVEIEFPAELGELSYERLNKMYLDWKAAVPLSKEKTNGGRQNGNSHPQSVDSETSPGIFAIVNRILSFPLSHKSPAEAHDFIAEVQQELLKHL